MSDHPEVSVPPLKSGDRSPYGLDESTAPKPEGPKSNGAESVGSVANARNIGEAPPSSPAAFDSASQTAAGRAGNAAAAASRDARENQESIHRLRLASIAVLRHLNVEELDWLVSRCHWTKFEPGCLILSQDENSNDVYFICSGTVRGAIYSSVGHQVIYQTMAEGTMFGEIAAIDGAPRSLHVIAETHCLLARLGAAEFLELMRRQPDFALSVTRQIIDTTRFLTARVFEFSALTVSQRIERELLRLCDSIGIREGDNVVIQSPPTHADLASRVNTHREAVTKHLNKLSKSGVLAKRGRTLIIQDIGALSDAVVQ